MVFGLTAEEAQLGEAVNAIVPEDRQRVAAAIAAACEPGAATYSEEYAVINRLTGQRRIIHALGRVVPGADGRPQRLDGTARDVTLERGLQQTLERLVKERTEELAAANEELQSTNEELQITNERLIHSNEELAQYAYVASHDLQEPLRKIRLFSDLLGKQKALAGESRPLVSRINRSAERMSMLINDLLEFSRLLNADSQFRPVDLSATVAAIVDDFELSISEKSALVTAEPLPVIEAVPLQMNQLFYNLLSNALKFTDATRPPRISITARPLSAAEAEAISGKPQFAPGYVCLTFTDNGIGFDAAYAEQIFEVFKRLHSRDAYPGSGIGLALCRRIVANHRGFMYAQSTPGEGTSFQVVLPRTQDF